MEIKGLKDMMMIFFEMNGMPFNMNPMGEQVPNADEANNDGTKVAVDGHNVAHGVGGGDCASIMSPYNKKVVDKGKQPCVARKKMFGHFHVGTTSKKGIGNMIDISSDTNTSLSSVIVIGMTLDSEYAKKMINDDGVLAKFLFSKSRDPSEVMVDNGLAFLTRKYIMEFLPGNFIHAAIIDCFALQLSQDTRKENDRMPRYQGRVSCRYMQEALLGQSSIQEQIHGAIG